MERSRDWFVGPFTCFLFPPCSAMQNVSHLPPPFRTRSTSTERVAYVLLLGVLGYAAALLGEGLDVAARTARLQVWALGAAGVLAVATPNVLLPDPNTPMLQVLNWPPRRLLRYQVRPMRALWVLLVVPAALVALFDPTGAGHHVAAKLSVLGRAVLLITGTALYTMDRYMTMGRRAQQWQEGRAGQWYARLVEEAGQGVSVPRGLVPALFATAHCFLVAAAAVVATAAGAQAGQPLLTWGPGVLLLGLASVRLWRRRAAYDRHFYQTNALYREVLGDGPLAASGREPIPFDALYWVPQRWRPATWASLRQLDRRLPLGRLVALGHLGLWVLCGQGATGDAVTAYLLLFFAAQNAACGLLTAPSAAPPSLHLTLQRPADWIGTRTFLNLRWLAPHAASLGLVAFFDAAYGVPWVLTWLGVNLLFAVSAAAIATLATETRALRRHA